MQGLVLGIDGGGTKTRVLLAAADGVAMGEGVSGPCSLSSVPIGDAIAHVRKAFTAASRESGAAEGDIRAVCAGVAGWSQRQRRTEFTASLQTLFPQSIVEVVPDYVSAHAGATAGKPGIVVIAGTGSVAYGTNAVEEHHVAGAYGYVIDDAGSGYGVGRAILAAVMRSADGTGKSTTLKHRLLEHCSFSGVAEIVPAVYGGALGRLEIAALAPLATAAAEIDGDMAAKSILMRAGGALAVLAEAVSKRLFVLDDAPFPIAQVGSLWESGPFLTDVFHRSVARFAPQAIPGLPQLPPERGAVIRALQLSEKSESWRY